MLTIETRTSGDQDDMPDLPVQSEELHHPDFFGIWSRIVCMERYLIKYTKEDLDKIIILLTGSRQVGKTTLSKMLGNDFDYFNFDKPEDRTGLQIQGDTP